MNIIVDFNYPIKDGTEVKFRSPVDCSQVTGLVVHYDGGSQEFMFADAHGNNVGDIDHLFAEDVVVKVILDVTTSMAFVQNADTNAYLEGRFDDLTPDDSKTGNKTWSSKNTVDKLCPSFTESGAVAVCAPVEGYPLGVVSQIEPVLSGSGDPSPDNIRPIIGHTSCVLYHGGKNLFDDVDWFERHRFTPQADGSWLGKTVDEICFTNTAKKPGSMYFTSFAKADAANTNAPMYLYVYYTDGTEKAYLTLNNNITTFTTLTAQTDPAKTVDCIKWTFGGGGTYYIKDVQISFVDDKYEPYRGDTFTLGFGETVYGGSLDWKTGILTMEYGIQDLSALVWYGPEVAYSNRIYYTNPFPAAASMIAGGRKGWCSVFNCLNGITLGTLPNNSIVYSIAEFSGSVRIYIKADDIANVDALMAVLEGQKLVYQLAEPITIQLTPQEILALSGTNCLYSDTGDTQVTGKADPNAVIQDLYNKINALSSTMAALTGV